MPSLSFQAQFAPKVESGAKRCSIRAKRKHPIKVGDTLFLYTGMRTKACRKLRQAACTATTPIVIDGIRVFTNGQELTGNQVNRLAIDDGFPTLQAFWAFFHKTDGHFEGDLIEW